MFHLVVTLCIKIGVLFFNLKKAGIVKIALNVLLLGFNPTNIGWISVFLHCGFSKNVFSRERVKPPFFVTFDINKSQDFFENFIEIHKSLRRYEDFFCQY